MTAVGTFQGQAGPTKRTGDVGDGDEWCRQVAGDLDMDVRFEPVPLEDIREEIGAHLAALPGVVDSYYEEHISLSSHARIVIDGYSAGLTAIHRESLITRFALEPGFRGYGEAVFHALR